ncbi:monooxygenase [Parafrankia colletiae]|uniref:Monooxygenase n=1 Tax=Parafrankia colletiae TaxID=573497 RepID=A0A1S1QTD6_9ACTN|nr:MupA/Atu3671 family FMN-dependent luciferase-like monooxygenase [Parafrankia colletiae]MCK9899594.1 LLM class flavin-dependent oxidoreductase [Frankia sp. Cpl3]OHV37978.1 monooxygenase [Parafrankia colletiae]
MDFGLFYFANDNASGVESYRLLLDGARFADTHGFATVWTPERHFHEFGGPYPNPAVTGAAVAAVTARVNIRAGSVVAPLHHPVRIAEEWSIVDNLSGGRAGIAFAPGWHPGDFALAPDEFKRRKDVMLANLNLVRRLWRREEVELPTGLGSTAKVRSFPAPIQPELPFWLTSSGSRDTFLLAGELGAGVLTHLLGQDLDELGGKIREYRAVVADRHAAPGHVVLMLHTFLGPDRATVRSAVQEPFTEYLRSSVGLSTRAAGDLTTGEQLEQMDPDDLDFLVQRAFERHFEADGLFGTVADGMATLRRLAALGVDEVACLIDFIPDTDTVLAGLNYLNELKDRWNDGRAADA